MNAPPIGQAGVKVSPTGFISTRIAIVPGFGTELAPGLLTPGLAIVPGLGTEPAGLVASGLAIVPGLGTELSDDPMGHTLPPYFIYTGPWTPAGGSFIPLLPIPEPIEAPDLSVRPLPPWIVAFPLLNDFAAAPATPSTAVGTPMLPPSEPPTADERLRLIVGSTDREASELGEETPLEREIARYVQDYGSAALSAIYRVLFEQGVRAEIGSALLEALAILPGRVERAGRASIFRASLLHHAAEIRFEAARAILTVRDAQTADALKSAMEREKHPALRINLLQVLSSLEAARGPADH